MLITYFNTILISQIKTSAFKAVQLKNLRVKDAYDTKWDSLKKEMVIQKINPFEFDIYLRAFKNEGA